MNPYLFAHIPHDGAEVPFEMRAFQTRDEIEAALREADLVRDWHTDQLLDLTMVDQKFSFPYARTFCDVERFRSDPLEAVGQGVFYTKTVDGRFLRARNGHAEQVALSLYDSHHAIMSRAVQSSTGMVPVVMIDMHSYGDFQADQTGRAERPDICVGGDNTHTPAWMIEHTRAVFERHGYTTAYNQPYEGSIIPRGIMGNLEYATIMFEVHKRLYLIDQSRGVVEERGFAKLKLALGEAAAILRDEP